MPNWTTTPPTTTALNTLPMLRCPPQGKLTGLSLSADLIGCPTHYWRGQTTPCEGRSCEACEQGNPWRWHGYLAFWIPKKSETYLLEVTAQIGAKITEYRTKQTTLYGAAIELQRPSGRGNGRVHLRIKPSDLTGTELPPTPDVRAVLEHLWGLDKPTAATPTGRNGATPRNTRIEDAIARTTAQTRTNGQA